jgi:HlyD family secretion protein
MRLPRVRFTIGWLMVVVLVASMALWGLLVLRPRLLDPSVAEQIAEARYEQARLAREVAELAAVDIEKGVDPQSVLEIQGTAALAISDIERRIDRLEWSNKMHIRGYVSEATRTADQLTLKQAGFDADQARFQLESIKKQGKEKKIKELNAHVDKARANERAKLKAYRMEQNKRGRWSY